MHADLRQIGNGLQGFFLTGGAVEIVENLTQVQCMSVTTRLGIQQGLGHNASTLLITQICDHRAGIENKGHLRDSRSASSRLFFINDSLDVGMCRYLPLTESTSCLR